jgi:hypothetical protein
MSMDTAESKRESHKRLAAQILAQLPEERGEALIVLAIVRELVDWDYGMAHIGATVLKIIG